MCLYYFGETVNDTLAFYLQEGFFITSPSR